MPKPNPPELIDWNETPPPGSRLLALPPNLIAVGVALGAWNAWSCSPRARQRIHDYYTCSPRYICQPVPYWPGQ